MRQLKTTEIKKFRDWQLKKQKGICPICKQRVGDAVLDHHHKKRIGGSGQIRGVICRTCNSFIAKAENNAQRFGFKQKDLPTILRNISDYLDQDDLPFIHPSEKPPHKRLTKNSYKKLQKVYVGKAKFPLYPSTGKLTIALTKLFLEYNIVPEYYK